MNAQKLKAIGEVAAEDLQAFIKEAEDKILESIRQAEREAELEGSKPKFRLGFTVTLDLDKDGMEDKLAFGVKHTLSRNCEIPDPNQVPLELEEKPRVRAAKN